MANAIVGSLMIVGFATLVSTPIGILAGIYLAEFGGSRASRGPRASSSTSCCRRRRS
jgi:ABC-type phosphate transport system permease subunit